jgi:hypothetical protein
VAGLERELVLLHERRVVLAAVDWQRAHGAHDHAADPRLEERAHGEEVDAPRELRAQHECVSECGRMVRHDEQRAV